ncbi:unnamed protein product [Lactuca saligna]|uniref:Uncharacterized protein n=1 Tax=Lactuca saligna TaxID=75948 RepID=A0AA36EP68_LACSI|nr:unnamed protein product [Lactuca saligna]
MIGRGWEPRICSREFSGAVKRGWKPREILRGDSVGIVLLFSGYLVHLWGRTRMSMHGEGLGFGPSFGGELVSGRTARDFSSHWIKEMESVFRTSPYLFGAKDSFGFLSEHGVMIPEKGVSIYACPQEKVGVPIPLFEVQLRLPTSNFFNMIVDHYGLSIDELTPSALNKNVSSELIC